MHEDNRALQEIAQSLPLPGDTPFTDAIELAAQYMDHLDIVCRPFKIQQARSIQILDLQT